MQGDDFVMYRSLAEVNDVHVRFIQDKIDTMEKVFRFAVRQHGQKSAVGTREILAEEDEVQPNGRVFKKVNTSFNFNNISIKVVEYIFINIDSTVPQEEITIIFQNKQSLEYVTLTKSASDLWLGLARTFCNVGSTAR